METEVVLSGGDFGGTTLVVTEPTPNQEVQVQHCLYRISETLDSAVFIGTV